MSPRIAVALAALLAALVTACSTEGTFSAPAGSTPETGPSATAPAVVPAQPEPAPTCSWPPGAEVSTKGSGFVAELNIMSGLPNPAWRLTRAEGAELRRLLTSSPDELDLDGLDELGGYGVTAHRSAATFLARLGLPARFWVEAEGEIATFLGQTLPCTAADTATTSSTSCAVLEYDGRTYRLTQRPAETGPGVGRILGEGRTAGCAQGGGELVVVHSVNEQRPEEAVVISAGPVVLLYTRTVD